MQMFLFIIMGFGRDIRISTLQYNTIRYNVIEYGAIECTVISSYGSKTTPVLLTFDIFPN